MASKHDNVAKVRSELEAWLSIVGNARLEQCMRYVALNEDTVSDMVDSQGVNAVVDHVVDIAVTSCHGGNCE